MDLERLAIRVQVHAALADPCRLAIVDELALSDRAPSELSAALGITSNLVAHHLSVLEAVGLIERIGSQGDRRRRYVRLSAAGLAVVRPHDVGSAIRIVFVCTENAARSQLAEAIWNHEQSVEATSGGIAPARTIYPGALRAAERRGLDLSEAKPRPLPRLRRSDLVVTVCDRAHETLRTREGMSRVHWSVPDPARSSRSDVYDTAAETIAERIHVLAGK